MSLAKRTVVLKKKKRNKVPVSCLGAKTRNKAVSKRREGIGKGKKHVRPYASVRELKKQGGRGDQTGDEKRHSVGAPGKREGGIKKVCFKREKVKGPGHAQRSGF